MRLNKEPFQEVLKKESSIMIVVGKIKWYAEKKAQHTAI
jgi:hypothetical protein